jgi:hypothetical protein
MGNFQLVFSCIRLNQIVMPTIIQFISKLPMVKKLKDSSCSPSWCVNHLFELNPLKSGLHFKKPFKFRLCPKHNRYPFFAI